MTLLLPAPLYAGTSLLVSNQFFAPVVGQPQNAWPLVDPTTVSLVWIGGTGASPVTWTYAGSQITKVSVGVYSAILATAGAPGRWQVKWVGTGSCPVEVIQGFDVESPPF